MVLTRQRSIQNHSKDLCPREDHKYFIVFELLADPYHVLLRDLHEFHLPVAPEVDDREYCRDCISVLDSFSHPILTELSQT
jgi:hypothetical protein